MWKAKIRETEGGQKEQQETDERRGNAEAHVHQGRAAFLPFKCYLHFSFLNIL